MISTRPASNSLAISAWILVLLALLEIPAMAQDSTSAGDGSWMDGLSIHGYLTLGWADLNLGNQDSRLADQIILGIEDDGSFPYGNAALHLRYDVNPRHAFILQVAASDFGDSPLDDVEGNVELDWLFYQGHLGDHTWLRLGRFPVPVGIFNELRDVGVVLPFFRPSFVFYREGGLFSETVDGAGLHHHFLARHPWSLKADVFYGEFDVVEQGVGTITEVSEVDASDALGSQLWLNTPVDGLRFGLGGLRWDVSEESLFSDQEETFESWYGSVEADFERFVARAEYRQLLVDFNTAPGQPPFSIDFDSYYFQLGWRATESLSFYVQPEYSHIEQTSPIFVDGSETSRIRKDLGASIVYAFTPTVILKGEYHEVDSEVPGGTDVVFGPMGPKIRTLYQDFNSDYTIVSLALSF